MSRVRRGREWVEERDPHSLLTPRQAEIVHWVRAFGGNRSRAARHLGIPVQGVQYAVRAATAAGVRVPPGARRGTDLTQRRRTA